MLSMYVISIKKECDVLKTIKLLLRDYLRDKFYISDVSDKKIQIEVTVTNNFKFKYFALLVLCRLAKSNVFINCMAWSL